MSPTLPHRGALSKGALLVLCGILVVLAGITAAAIQKVRDAAARSQST